MQRIKRLACILLLSTPFVAIGQVIPPGLGKNPLASWMAGSISQKIDSTRNWNSSTYLGIGTISHPDNYHLFQKFGVLIVNQAFEHTFYQNWNVSTEFLYARQNQYEKTFPYHAADDPIRNEFRLYGRISYAWKINDFVEITPTYRHEFQKYFTHDFKNPNETFRIRSRFRLKVKFTLTKDRQHALSLFSEQLFSTSYLLQQSSFSPFQYKDSRFSIYYSFSPRTAPIVLNIGYMNNLIGIQSPFPAHLIAVDIVWKNPFTRKKASSK